MDPTRNTKGHRGDDDGRGPFSRRTFLGTVGAASVALAGCMNGGSDGNGDESNGTGNGNGNESNDTGGDNESGNESDGGEENESNAAAAAIDYGELIDDFQDGGGWFAGGDVQLTPDDSEAVVGEHSLRVESESDVATIAWAAASPLDFSDQYLSMAVKVAAPLGGRLQLGIRAPGSSDRVVSTRRLPPGIDDWFRVDFGYTRGIGNPNFERVQEVRLEMVAPDGGPIQYWVDDFRATPARDESNVIMAFYGGLESHYETVFPLLEERGWTGVAAVSQDLLNRSGRLSIDQLREMRDAGWEVCSFPQHAGRLPQLDAEEQRRVIENNRDYLANRGFEDGSRHFFAPYNTMNTDTLNVLRDTHELGFLFGGNSSGIPPTGRHTVSTINGGDYDSSRAAILRADIHNQVVVPYFEEIGEEGMAVEDFEAQLDRIEDNSYGSGLVPITPSELLEYY